MTPPGLSAAGPLLYLFALAWVWDVYVYVPVLGINLTVCIGAVLVVLWMTDVTSGTRLRIPFELAWPAVLLVGLAWMRAWYGEATRPIATTGAMLVFAATVQYACSRDAIAKCLWLSSLSGAFVALLTLLSRAGLLMPTAYSLNFGLSPAGVPNAADVLARGILSRSVNLPYLAFAGDIPDGMVTLLVCALAATWFAVRGQSSPIRRLARTCLVPLVIVTVPVLFWTIAHASQRRLPQPLRTSGLALAALATAVWLGARVAAKLEVDRRDSRPGLHVVLITMLGAGAVVALCTPWTPRLSHVFLLGLAAAYAISDEQGAAARWRWRPVAIISLALVSWNLWRVDPANRQDPRNYDVALQRHYEAGEIGQVLRRVAFLEALSPDERKTHLWRARTALREARPHEAAAEFAASLAPSNKQRTILPAPNEAEQEDFLMRIRDYCSSLPQPERSFGYEMALIAAGRTDGALAVLKYRAGVAEEATRPFPRMTFEPSWALSAEDSETLDSAVATILGKQDLAETLAAWPSSTILALLTNWGASIETAPSLFPRDALPLILVGQVGAGGANVSAFAGNHFVTRPVPLNPTSDKRLVNETEWTGWTPLTDDGTDSWTSTIAIAHTHAHPREVARIVVSSEGLLELQVHPLCPLMPPDSPAIRVWLP